MIKSRRLSIYALTALLGLGGTSVLAQSIAAPGRIKITKLADLPPHTYAVSGKAADFIKDDAKVQALATQVGTDIRHDLATYDIEDRSTLLALYSNLNETALLQHDYPAILANSARLKAQLRSAPDKPQDGLTGAAFSTALLKSIQYPGVDFPRTLKSNLQDALEALPYEKVQDYLKSDRAKYEILSEPVLDGYYLPTIDTAMQTGVISQSTAESLLSASLLERYILPNRSVLITAYTNVIAEHKAVMKANIWPSRDIVLIASQKLHPVLVGIWDTGVDLKLFPNHAWSDVNGTHGIAWNSALNPSALLLYPLPTADQQYHAYFEGMMDLEAGVDSPDAAAVRAKLASLSQDQVKSFSDGLEQYTDYAHGTFIAEIALRGNPAARLVVCRKSPNGTEDASVAEGKLADSLPFDAQEKKFVNEFAASVAYLKSHQIHVVNVSWGIGLSDVEDNFDQSQVAGTPAERRAKAKQVFDTLRSTIYQSMEAAPETLYVVAVGNDDNNVNFSGEVPASFHLPNVLVVGAVDQAGDQTSFTSFGNIDVYADGLEVDSLLPGGGHAKASGTSAAAPQVTNLAAKLLAVNPALTVAQVKAIIISTADTRRVGTKTVRLINPKKAVAEVEQNHFANK